MRSGTEVTMPKLGESVVEGTIGKWLKKPGDEVKADEPLMEVDTDKVSAEVPSPVGGVIGRILVEEGQTVPVGTVVAVIVDAKSHGTEDAVSRDADHRAGDGDHGARRPTRGEADPQPDREIIVVDQETGTRDAISVPMYAPGATGPKDLEAAAVKEVDKAQGLLSPAVRQLAELHEIDVAKIQGTGEAGRVTRRDLEAVIADITEKVPVVAEQTPGAVAEENDVWPSDFSDRIIPVTTKRRTIARRMVESKRTVPHAWTMVEVDVTSLVGWRESIKEEFRKREGVNLTYLPFVIKAAVEGLKEFPIMNSQWDNDRIVLKRHINIGIAVDLDDGLVVPVIKDADQMSIVGIAHAVHDLAARARAGTLQVDDLQGGTFTINNTGAFGSIMSAPIINYPQAAILSMETITKRPCVINDGIAIRSMMNMCCSIDHRILDGAVCGRFLRSVKRRLESYRAEMPLY